MLGHYSFCRLTVLAVCSVFLSASRTEACLWYFGTNLAGAATKPIMNLEPKWLTKSMSDGHKKVWKSNYEYFRGLLRKNGTLKPRQQNDYAVSLIFMGKIKEAIEVLKALEQSSPNRYQTAANLGTAFELLGDNKRAIQWIKTGIDRNADAHFGSEWVHVRILEAKMKLAADPNWLQKNSILGIHFGDAAKPQPNRQDVVDHQGNKRDFKQAWRHIMSQLKERMTLVKPPNAIVGDLLFELANFAAHGEAVENGIVFAELSLKYKPTKPELVKRRLNYFRGLVKKNPLSLRRTNRSGTENTDVKDRSASARKGPATPWLVVATTLALATAGLMLVYRSRKRSPHKTDGKP